MADRRETPGGPKKTAIETTPTARLTLRVLAAQSQMPMREYLEWLALEAMKRGLVAGLPAKEYGAMNNGGRED